MAKAKPHAAHAGSQWYKDAIIYELHVRAFHDSNNDGVGDFRGLVQKLDYLADLGVTALWLLPFYPSPQRDDGYDIADYTDIHPSYGSLRDFREFLKEAHRRGLRVITELVLNHTSDQHEWFQKSRRAAPGNPWRDFYVWSDDPSKYSDARIIFKDFEASNWTWDPVAKAYYWHRFYSHQPDLNFDNPRVRKKLMELVDFWFEMGVDGLRLDAVPYLFEREGTSCENLVETHQYLRQLRAHVDRKFPDKMLLAEANQWPEDAVNYFGEGDECHMAFHFPLMPRLFMALRLEDRFSIIDILRQTPHIPDNCQWATFLRNHDELTLEMVTDEERDYMYNSYAAEPRARINLGIRRRLSPLLGGDRRQVELLNALLFSLPGTPVIYYGDEIGMGDNIFLGDRNAVRTPFQWTPDRNAGFSKADPQQLFLPVIIAPEYHFATVNVENQERNSNSLLWWMKNLIAFRRHYKALNRGTLEFLEPDNTKVLAFLRHHEDQTILVVANLSRKAQCVELDLSRFTGMTPLEVFGQVEFPHIGSLPYFITLGPYSFYWFHLSQEDVALNRPLLMTSPAVIEVAGKPVEALRTDKKVKRKLQSDLPAYLRNMRWFGGKSQDIENCHIESIIPLEVSKDKAHFAFAVTKVNYRDGDPERYLLTIGYAEDDHAARISHESPSAVISSNIRRADTSKEGIYYDATVESEFFQEVLYFILKRRKASGDKKQVMSPQTFHPIRRAWLKEPPRPSYRGFEQSNTSVLYGNQFFLKLYRKLESGVNPEVEIGEFLTTKKKKSHLTPDLIASLRLNETSRRFYDLGILASFVPNEGDAWKFTINYLSQLSEEELAEKSLQPQTFEDGSSAAVFDRMDREPPQEVRNVIEHYLHMATVLGTRVGELHLSLGADAGRSEFAPEEFTPFYQRSLYQSMRNNTEKTLKTIKNNLDSMKPETRALAEAVLDRKKDITTAFSRLKSKNIKAKRIRCHGDLHLGQILFTGKDFIILDFEGEPARPIGERKLKVTPLRDVAGMLRSFDYATYFVEKQNLIRPEDVEALRPVFSAWSAWTKSEFLKAYVNTVQKGSLIPKDKQAFRILAEVYLLDKVLYEIRYEINNRPDWADIPMQGLFGILARRGDEG